MIARANFRIMVIFINIGLSIAGKDLIGISVSLDPVVDLVRGRAPAVEATTVESTTKSGFASSFMNRFGGGGSSEKKSECGKRQMEHTGLITGGQSTKPGDWPWHVALYKLKTSSAEQKYICGGTLLSKTLVLTAGHCVMESGAVISPERLFAVMGKYNLAGGDIASQERGVFEITTHPDFEQSTLSNDVALLKLLSQVTYTSYVQPICLWKGDTSKSKIVNQMGIVVGWGFTESDALGTELMMASMPVHDDLDCVKTNALFYSKYLTRFTFCAGFGNGTGACNGDSGGGMYFSRKSDNGEVLWYLRGITSLAVSRSDKNLCDSNFYTVFTDAAQYLDFIKPK